ALIESKQGMLSDTLAQWSPWSFESHSIACFDSISAYTWPGFVRPTASATHPMRPGGRPSLSLSHVRPPSLERWTPLPGPPETSSHGWRTTCHVPANSTRGLVGTITRSDTPV